MFDFKFIIFCDATFLYYYCHIRDDTSSLLFSLNNAFTEFTNTNQLYIGNKTVQYDLKALVLEEHLLLFIKLQFVNAEKLC